MLKHLIRAMSTSSAATRPRPVVAIIGTTGSGKSQLAVSLAQSLSALRPAAFSHDSTIPERGIVLSADSMQLYKGLDVITNKVTSEEMGGVEHWGLDIVQPGEGGSWDVGRWCGEADRRVSPFYPTCFRAVYKLNSM
jgi:tRNA dimethylallyltransferase